MARKLSKKSQQRVRRNLALLEGISDIANSISEESITDLIRRDAIGVGNDGYPSNSAVEYASGGGFSGSSTETAALFGLPGSKGGVDDWEKKQNKRRSADEVRLQISIIENSLREAHGFLKQASAAVNYLTNKTEEVKGRQAASAPCSICGVGAAQKSGWCLKDYADWVEDGRPDRFLYEMWRRQDTNSEGVVLVSIKPEPKAKT